MAMDFVDEVLVHCAYAVGSGARMKIDRAALIALRNHVEAPAGEAEMGFRFALTRPQNPLDPKDPPPGEPRWKPVRGFVLDCCDAVGQLAAMKALERGSRVIELDDLKKAYNIVSATNSGLPGPFCPGI
jgi:hypothetical protein